MFARPAVYEALLRRIPPERISMNKRILQVKERNNKVRIECIDNIYFEGDTLAGANGVYSAVRQNIYRDMTKDGILPKEDGENLKAGYTCMVSTTDKLDTDRYPQLKDNFVHFATALGGAAYTVSKKKKKKKKKFTVVTNKTYLTFPLLQWNVINIPGQRIA